MSKIRPMRRHKMSYEATIFRIERQILGRTFRPCRRAR